MARYVGRDLVVQWITTAGTYNVSADFRTLESSEETESADASAGTGLHKFFIPTIKNTTLSYQFVDQTGGTANWNQFAPQTAGTLIWSPEGTTTGKPKHTATDVFVVNRNRTFPYDNVVEISVELQSNVVPTIGAH